MDNMYYTVDQISELLSLHPKTVQRYIREGKLRATKIGKGWRITGHDLSVFTENMQTSDKSYTNDEADVADVTVSAVVDIAVANKNDAIRIMNTLTAALNCKPPEFGRSSLRTQFIESESKVRATLWGGSRFTAVIMYTIADLTENNEME